MGQTMLDMYLWYSMMYHGCFCTRVKPTMCMAKLRRMLRITESSRGGEISRPAGLKGTSLGLAPFRFTTKHIQGWHAWEQENAGFLIIRVGWLPHLSSLHLSSLFLHQMVINTEMDYDWSEQRMRDCGMLSPKWDIGVTARSPKTLRSLQTGAGVGDRKNVQWELRDDGDETVSSGYRAVARVSSQQSWYLAQDLCKCKPDQIPAKNGELGIKHYPCLRRYWQLIASGRRFSLRVYRQLSQFCSSGKIHIQE